MTYVGINNNDCVRNKTVRILVFIIFMTHYIYDQETEVCSRLHHIEDGICVYIRTDCVDFLKKDTVLLEHEKAVDNNYYDRPDGVAIRWKAP